MGKVRADKTLRTFPVTGLEHDAEGRAVLKVNGKVVYVVEVARGTATLSTGAEGPARVVANFDTPETLEAILEGRLHPVVAALQGRFVQIEGDRRFGLTSLLALRASAPVFAEGGA
jgi:hypothetical protein